MENTKWLKQAKDKSLFPDLLWSRPENRRHAGKLLIIGGNSHAFSVVSSAYAAAGKAGTGSARILLPDALTKSLSKIFPEAEFAPSTPSGSLARASLAALIDNSAWADGVMLAGDFGRNSETAILLESFSEKYSGNLTLTGDSLDYFLDEPGRILDREQTTLIAEFGRLQKLISGRLLLKHSMNLAQIVESLATFSSNCPVAVITHHSDQLIVANSGQVSTTPKDKVNLTELAAYASVWRLQQPAQPFEALTCAAYCYTN